MNEAVSSVSRKVVLLGKAVLVSILYSAVPMWERDDPHV